MSHSIRGRVSAKKAIENGLILCPIIQVLRTWFPTARKVSWWYSNDLTGDVMFCAEFNG